MASVSASTTTAIDVPTLVSQLMAVERQPLDKLNTDVTDTQSKISSFGTLSSLVSGFQTASSNLSASLQKLAATPSDTGVLSATADSTAVPGTYSVNVTKLAQSQNLLTAGQASTTVAIGTGTATTITFDFGTISGGTLTNGVYSGAAFTSNGSGTQSITIDGTNNTLAGIRDAINNAGLGVTATIVNDGSGTPYHLVLTSKNSGVANSLKITTSGGDAAIDGLLAYDPAGTQNLTQTQAAQNASLTVNGIAVTSATNTVSGAIQGVTMTLKNTTASPISLAIDRDTAGINSAASSFADAYNALASQIKSRSAYASNGQKGGTLAGDGTLRLMQDQLRGIFNTPATGGTLTALAQVGIALQSDGSLKVDSGMLNSALSANFSDVTNLLSSSTGFATRFKTWAQAALDPGGLIDARTQSLKKHIDDQNTAIDRLQSRLDALQKKYTAEYTNLNLMLSSMNSTSAYLTAQLGSGK
ncbi:flagellar filament capping protein FliD [Thiobacillus sedimenti]|uniref:Flagellar hook-associated protein 2 n=1 Tax=Thiobacillus sedimenti TaxID=3110231 RepID=A0ABZ1CLP4_9PROT|nr:flagellar filament capping protein FliD [Thiobacillus sp. SCUT-2]WRS40269.1 flagellar filament capping protein FliD [Thiobacillus sp. SCUT-2]